MRLGAGVRGFVAHTRLGVVHGLSLVIAIGILLSMLDYYRFYSSGVDLGVGFGYPSADTLLKGVALFLFLGLILPNLVTPWVVWSRGSNWVTQSVRGTSTGFAFIYFLSSAILSIFVVILTGLESASGLLVRGGQRYFATSSYLVSATGAWPIVLATVVSAASALLATSNRFLGIPGRVSLAEYASRLDLLALDLKYAPLHGRSVSNLNAGGLAPCLKGVLDERQTLESEYQELAPGSFGAKSYLETLWVECKQLLKSLGVIESPGVQIRLAPSTGRAIEAAVDEVDSRCIAILSPFEHPSERAVLSERHELIVQPAPSEFWEASWIARQKAILKNLESILEGANARSFAYILSEVHYLTGEVLPIHEFAIGFNQLANRYVGEGKCLRLIVDGAHAAGHLRGGRPTEDCFAYVFSTHKWMLSPDPAGVIVGGAAAERYDFWVGGLPVASSSISRLGGAVAACRFLGRTSFSDRLGRSARLRDSFLKRVSERLRRLGSSELIGDSLIVLLAPRPGYKWVYEEGDLRRFVEDNGVLAEVSAFQGSTVLRCCFAFFLDWRATVSSAKVLLRAVEKRMTHD